MGKSHQARVRVGADEVRRLAKGETVVWGLLLNRYVLGGLAIVAALYLCYDWSFDRGYEKRDSEQRVAEDRRATQIEGLQEEVREGNKKLEAKHEQLVKANSATAAAETKKVAAILAARAAARNVPAAPAAGGVPDAPGVDVPAVPGCACTADDAADLSRISIEATRIATENADKVTAWQAWYEANRREYHKALNIPDARKPTDAEARLNALIKLQQAVTQPTGKTQ